VAWTAYGLATPYHECAGTMLPIVERGGADYLRRKYDVTGLNPERAKAFGNISPGDGALYCGRGLVQLTWRSNYLKAEQALGFPLVSQPELACRPDVAAAVMTWGMACGAFTGVGLGRYLHEQLPATQRQFRDARRVINGLDDADLIASYALVFQDALSLGGWGA
jgi:putative chitinase